MPDDGLRLIDVVEFETTQPDVTYEYVHKAYAGYQIRLSVPRGNYRFRARASGTRRGAACAEVQRRARRPRCR